MTGEGVAEGGRRREDSIGRKKFPPGRTRTVGSARCRADVKPANAQGHEQRRVHPARQKKNSTTEKRTKRRCQDPVQRPGQCSVPTSHPSNAPPRTAHHYTDTSEPPQQKQAPHSPAEFGALPTTHGCPPPEKSPPSPLPVFIREYSAPCRHPSPMPSPPSPSPSSPVNPPPAATHHTKPTFSNFFTTSSTRSDTLLLSRYPTGADASSAAEAVVWRPADGRRAASRGPRRAAAGVAAPVATAAAAAAPRTAAPPTTGPAAVRGAERASADRPAAAAGVAPARAVASARPAAAAVRSIVTAGDEIGGRRGGGKERRDNGQDREPQASGRGGARGGGGQGGAEKEGVAGMMGQAVPEGGAGGDDDRGTGGKATAAEATRERGHHDRAGSQNPLTIASWGTTFPSHKFRNISELLVSIQFLNFIRQLWLLIELRRSEQDLCDHLAS